MKAQDEIDLFVGRALASIFSICQRDVFGTNASCAGSNNMLLPILLVLISPCVSSLLGSWARPLEANLGATRVFLERQLRH